MMTKWMEDWKSVVHKQPHYEKKIYMVTNKKNPHQSLNFIDSDDRMKEKRIEDTQELIINLCQGAVIEIQSRFTNLLLESLEVCVGSESEGNLSTLLQ